MIGLVACGQLFKLNEGFNHRRTHDSRWLDNGRTSSDLKLVDNCRDCSFSLLESLVVEDVRLTGGFVLRKAHEHEFQEIKMKLSQRAGHRPDLSFKFAEKLKNLLRAFSVAAADHHLGFL